ncbi:dihydroorotase, multifunctional complex type [Gloeothece citriformis PCC 7424]|uniref:Dihydroorotase, multifunctional complex type n=1 Tax=Gloeothece citriformis (strain PCC 7424) TaxID=65393 RepID=B7K794_GLOC7|nr:dihydroorotase [Gloeothece citriformis]ACK69662.1 dihydroorotase, multifunctional complex type [Gloeothece citriformis PCC 7424]
MKSDSNQVLRQVRVLDPVSNTDKIADVLISNGRIESIDSPIENVPEQTTEIEAQGLVLAPGLMDLYSHSGEPGHEERETFLSLASAASVGGFTRVAIVPDTIPPVDNPAIVALLEQKIETIRQEISQPLFPPSHLQFWGAISINREGQQMTELADLAETSIIGFSDGRPVENLGLLRRVLEYLNPLNKPIALVATNRDLRGNGVMREGFASMTYGLPGNPIISESAALAALLEVIAAIKTPVHLMGISTRRGVELIADAKARKVPVTASTTWMHLLLNTNALKSYDPNLRLEPPLGNEDDRQALIDGIKQGIIDAIAVDHTPYTYEEKTVAFAEAPCGVIGLELVLPLLWQQFVITEEWSALKLWQILSVNPRLCVHQPPISCQPGHRAELILFDPQQTWTLSTQTLKSRSHNTPWLGKQLTGRVVRVWNPNL